MSGNVKFVNRDVLSDMLLFIAVGYWFTRTRTGHGKEGMNEGE